ncbi:MAG TPA: TlpA family protein disulfide reductase [Puia sp.]|nr:TlpA family protein disulfide reductase [Puia sp.]
MRMLFFSLVLVITGLAAAPCPAWGQTRAQEIRKFKVTELEEYIRQCDHPLIVNFWATFCTPCLKEIPYLQSTVAGYKDKEVELLLVSLDLPSYYPGRIAAFAQKTNIVAKLAWLDEKDAGYFCPQIDKKWSGGIPASLFINNRTHYREFFDRQLTDRQVEQQLKLLTAP